MYVHQFCAGVYANIFYMTSTVIPLPSSVASASSPATTESEEANDNLSPQHNALLYDGKCSQFNLGQN